MAVDEASFTFVSASEHQDTRTSEARSVASGVEVDVSKTEAISSTPGHIYKGCPLDTCWGISLAADSVVA
eukprot:3717679-Rhodomonas_salina.2